MMFFSLIRVYTSAAGAKKRNDLTFDDEDDLMDALGFEETPKTQGNGLIQKKERYSLVLQMLKDKKKRI